MSKLEQYGVRRTERSQQWQMLFRFSRRLLLWRRLLSNFLSNSIFEQVKISIIEIHFHWLSTNARTKTAWAPLFYTLCWRAHSTRGGGVGS